MQLLFKLLTQLETPKDEAGCAFNAIHTKYLAKLKAQHTAAKNINPQNEVLITPAKPLDDAFMSSRFVLKNANSSETSIDPELLQPATLTKLQRFPTTEVHSPLSRVHFPQPNAKITPQKIGFLAPSSITPSTSSRLGSVMAAIEQATSVRLSSSHSASANTFAKCSTPQNCSPVGNGSLKIFSASKPLNSPLSATGSVGRRTSHTSDAKSTPGHSPLTAASAVDRKLKGVLEKKLEMERERLLQLKQKETERSLRMQKAVMQKQKLEEELRQKRQDHYQKVLKAKGKEAATRTTEENVFNVTPDAVTSARKRVQEATPQKTDGSLLPPQTPILPDILSECETSCVKKRGNTAAFNDAQPLSKLPKWSMTPEVRRALVRQSAHDPDAIFGDPKPFNFSEIFKLSSADAAKPQGASTNVAQKAF